MSDSSGEMKQGLISVIVPVYNAGATLSRCIDSILLQSHHDVEIILVDDGSTDDSLSICNAFADCRDDVIVLSQENAGPSVARNNGLDHANGEYIAFVDSDDHIDPRMLERLVEPLAAGSSLSCCGVKKAYGNDVRLFPICDCDSLVGPRTYLYDMLLGDLAGYACNRLYRRELVGETRFPVDLKFAEDLVFNCMLWSRIHEVAYVSDCLYVYEQHSGSLTNSTDAFIVDGKWVFSLLTPHLEAALPNDPWIKEILAYRNACRALDGIRLLSGDKKNAALRSRLIEEFRFDWEIYWKHQKSLEKRVLAWLTVALPESMVRFGMSLLSED